MLGVLHEDSFGPIGYGLHSPPASGSFKPTFPGPDAAFETFDHLISSPASVGSNRTNDLGDLYFGEREAIKLAFAEYATTANGLLANQGTAATPGQALILQPLTVPNTEKGVNSGDNFNVSAVAVDGSIRLTKDGYSESHLYSFQANAGDMYSFEALSQELTRDAGRTIDTTLAVYSQDAKGNLIPVPYFGGTAYNDDNFESSDSVLFDVTLPASFNNTYFVKVDTFTHADLVPTQDNAQGDYTLFLYKFGTAASTDAGDHITAGSGNETLLGGLGGDTITAGTGHDVIDFGDGSGAFGIAAQQTINAGGTAPLSVQANDATVTWTIGEQSSTGPAFNFSPADNGNYSIQYTITRPGGESFTGSVPVTVQNVVPTPALIAPASGFAGQAVTVTVSATDPANSDRAAGFTYTINWGDNSTPDVIAPTAGNGSGVSFSHTYSDAGTYAVTVTATDAEHASQVTASTVTVLFAPTATISGTTTLIEGSTTTLTANVTPANSSYAYAWTAKRSDGSTVQTGAGQSFTFAQATAGTYSVAVTVTDPSGRSLAATAQTTVTVNSATPTVSISGTPTNPVNEGTAVTLTANASNPTNQSLTYAWSVTKTHGSATTTNFATGSTYSFTFTPDDDGTYVVSLKVTYPNLTNPATATATLTAANIAPSQPAISVSSAAPYFTGQTVTFTAAGVTDAGADQSASFNYVWQLDGATQTGQSGMTFVYKPTAAGAAHDHRGRHRQGRSHRHRREHFDQLHRSQRHHQRRPHGRGRGRLGRDRLDRGGE